MGRSGIEIASDVGDLFHEMKLKHTHKWATFKIDDEVVVDKTGDAVSTEDKAEDKAAFMKLAEQFQDEPRYALYDFEFKDKNGRKIHKLAFIVWNPDSGRSIKLKMRYASSKDALKKTFSGLSLEFQMNDQEDIDYDAIAEEVEKRS